MTTGGLSPTLVSDSGLQALLTVAALHGIPADAAQLIHEFGPHLGQRGFNSQTLLLAAQRIGMSARSVRQDPQRLVHAPLPAIACGRDGHFFLLVRVDVDPAWGHAIWVQYPGHAPRRMALAELISTWNGELLYLQSKANFASEASRFDFTWFIPAIIKYRRLLGDVVLLSLALQIIGLATPLFFQVVMDKVIVNHAMKTLDVIAIGLVCATLFESALTGIRSWVFTHTSSKIDVELGARLFRHLLALPLAYFQARRVGDSVARIRELENIRSFLTGNALSLILDLSFAVLFIGVLFWYSPALTLIVLASMPLYALLSLSFTPVLRKRLNEKFNRGAENQSFLVETITGIDTVKSMAVEPGWLHQWEQQLASYVTSALRVSNVATIATGGVSLVGKLTTATIMWFGASLVIDGKLSLGELIAFNMLASQVSSPILRLAQLWNDFQQVGISMHRLGDILNAPNEVAGQRSRLPRIEGAIEFERISFRYRPDSADVLRDIQLQIQPGEVVGIVGRSGSGKSTLTKLVQRLYVPDRGRVLVDGQDLSIVDTASLRQQIGVVLQENTLFSRSIRDNIALAHPTAPIEQVIAAAKLAGAHEFICALARGYDTWVGEHGTGLSGGQRQRIAIARALMTQPRILIFDEATSALDYESEKIIHDHMRQICQGRTVLIIAHRLSAVRNADRIAVLEQGEIAEIGSHAELLRSPGGIYAGLHALQIGEPQERASDPPAPPTPRAWPREFSSSYTAEGQTK